MIVRVTNHAVERYQERVRPALDRQGAFDELVRLLRAAGDVVEDLPVWAHHTEDDDVKFDAVAMLGPDIAAPCHLTQGGYLLAVTVIARGWLPDGARQHRNRVHRARRQRTRMRAAKHHERSMAKRRKHEAA